MIGDDNNMYNNMPEQNNNGMNNSVPPMNNNVPPMNNSVPPMNNYNEMNNTPNNMPPVNNSYQNTPAPKNNKTMIIIIGVIVGILAIVGIYFIVKSLSPKPTYEDFEQNYKEKLAKENAEISKNIKTDYVKLANGDYLVILENNNSKTIDAECTVEFYNNDEITYTDEAFFTGYIKGNSKSYALLYNSKLNKYTFNKLVPKVTANYHISKEYGDEITHTEEIKDDEVVVKVVNNSKDALDSITVAAVYYDANGKIIGYERDYISSNLGVGATNYAELDFPTDENYHDIQFAKYDIIVIADNYDTDK